MRAEPKMPPTPSNPVTCPLFVQALRYDIPEPPQMPPVQRPAADVSHSVYFIAPVMTPELVLVDTESVSATPIMPPAPE